MNTKKRIKNSDLSFKLTLQGLEAEVQNNQIHIENSKKNKKILTFNAQVIPDLNRRRRPSNCLSSSGFETCVKTGTLWAYEICQTTFFLTRNPNIFITKDLRYNVVLFKETVAKTPNDEFDLSFKLKL